MILTKNLQTEQTLAAMTARAFPGQSMTSFTLLPEGMCNAAYRINLSGGGETIVKIAPAHRENLLSCEVNLMAAEVRAMQLVKEHTALPVPQVYHYDTACDLCTSPYFFMEVIPGKPLFPPDEGMDEALRQDLHRQIGRAFGEITSVTGDAFGLLGDDAHRFTRMVDFFRHLLSGVIADADRKHIDLGAEGHAILAALKQDEAIFDEVTVPRLIHWDMWEGNLFAKDGKLCGIIDWERAMFSDPLGDDRLRRHNRNECFLEGWGHPSFTRNEMRRILWYDVYLYIIMMTEGAYRGYPDDSQYRWVRPMFDASWAELKSL